MERTISTTSGQYKPSYSQHKLPRRVWRGRIHPDKWTHSANKEIAGDLKDNLFRLLMVFRACSSGTTGWFQVEIEYLVRKLGKKRRWIQVLKSRLIAKGYLEEWSQFNDRGEQIANFYRLLSPSAKTIETQEVLIDTGVHDSAPQYFKSSNTKPITSPPVEERTVEALAGELVAELNIAVSDELLSACRKTLSEKPANEVGALLKNQWRRWVVIAYLFPVGMTNKFWGTTRHYLGSLEIEATLKRLRIEMVRRESERSQRTERRPRQHHETRVSRPHCQVPSNPGADNQHNPDYAEADRLYAAYNGAYGDEKKRTAIRDEMKAKGFWWEDK